MSLEAEDFPLVTDRRRNLPPRAINNVLPDWRDVTVDELRRHPPRPEGWGFPLERSVSDRRPLLRVRISSHQVGQLEESDVVTRVSDVCEVVSIPGAAEQDVQRLPVCWRF